MNTGTPIQRNIPPGENHDQLTERIIGAAIEVHRHLGPGLTEEMYEEAYCHELDLLGIQYARQVPVAVMYKQKQIGKTRIDLIVENRVIVELKSCESLGPIHRAQCITYLNVTGKQVALLINFNVAILKDGVKRIVLTR
jgi:GxxExxY protein